VWGNILRPFYSLNLAYIWYVIKQAPFSGRESPEGIRIINFFEQLYTAYNSSWKNARTHIGNVYAFRIETTDHFFKPRGLTNFFYLSRLLFRQRPNNTSQNKSLKCKEIRENLANQEFISNLRTRNMRKSTTFCKLFSAKILFIIQVHISNSAPSAKNVVICETWW
jgi:hypothetical protein